MASKRKSTIPCMIPVKTMHVHDDREQGEGLTDCKPSRPVMFLSGEDSCGQGSQEAGETSSSERGSSQRQGGTYTCRPCNFESHDLNLFLDHVYSIHTDFRAEPSFYCLDCGVSTTKFEGLALHNAHAHPSTANTTLQVKKKDRRTTVEQSVVASEGSKESEIAITKTPIMKMLKGKSEPKRIVVSHSADDLDSLGSKEVEKVEPPAVTHVPTIVHNGAATKTALPTALQVVNGSGTLPMLKTAITQVVSVVQNRNLHQQSTSMTASASSSSTTSSRNLPKVMIPLSSIPTYNAAMDNSSFLKTSFSKFPYPTKAELCYLTVVTKYPEEQIKIWFTAQRLKQGISWSPEEIEDARRKMFNTIIQTAPPVSQQPQQRPSHHSPAQHTITVLPASLGQSSIPHILQGSLVGQGGVIVTQPVVANGLQVSSAPVALAVTPKPQVAAKPLMQARPTAALVADKGVSMVVGTVGSSSTGSTVIISSSSGGVSGCSSTNSSSNTITNSTRATSSSTSNTNTSSTSSTSTSSCSAASTSSSATSSTSITSSKTGSHTSVISMGSGSGNSSAHSVRSENGTSNTSTNTIDTNGGSSTNKTSSDDVVGSSEDKMADMLPPVSGTHSSRTLPSSFLDPSFYKNKKSQEQLSALKQSFIRCQFPSQEEVERLTKITGLTVREVRKWFSDRRYHYRNLKGSRSNTGTLFGGNSPLELADSPSSTETLKSSQSSQSPQQQQQHASPPTPSRRVSRQQAPDFTAIRYKERDPQQVRALEGSFSLSPTPSSEEVDRLRAETKMTRREIDGWFSERRKRAAAEKKREEAEKAEKEEEDDGGHVEEEAAAKDTKDDPSLGTSTPQQNKDEKQKEDTSGSEPKVNPIKINLKMLKVTESNGKHEAEAGLPAQTESPKTPPVATSIRGKKTPDQLHLLKQVFARTQWPSSPQYDELIAKTGLPRPEVVRWFGDSRYVYKNGQLKWLESYQQMADEEDYRKGDTEVLKEHLATHGKLEDDHVQRLVELSRLDEDLVRRWFATRSGLLPDEKVAEDPPGRETTAEQLLKEGQSDGSAKVPLTDEEIPRTADTQPPSTKQGSD